MRTQASPLVWSVLLIRGKNAEKFSTVNLAKQTTRGRMKCLVLFLLPTHILQLEMELPWTFLTFKGFNKAIYIVNNSTVKSKPFYKALFLKNLKGFLCAFISAFFFDNLKTHSWTIVQQLFCVWRKGMSNYCYWCSHISLFMKSMQISAYKPSFCILGGGTISVKHQYNSGF